MKVFSGKLNNPKFKQQRDLRLQAIVHPHKASLPSNLSSTLSHLNIQRDNWLGQVQSYGNRYYRFVGCVERLKAKAQALGQQWLKGINQAQKLYTEPS